MSARESEIEKIPNFFLVIYFSWPLDLWLIPSVPGRR